MQKHRDKSTVNSVMSWYSADTTLKETYGTPINQNI